MTEHVSSSWLEVPFSLVVGTGVTTFVLASALAYVVLTSQRQNHDKDNGSGSKKDGISSTDVEEESSKKEVGRSDGCKYPGGSLYIYYATQTGTAESFGRQLEREAFRYGFEAHVTDVEGITQLSDVQSPCIILSATYGEGEPTDNARVVVELLKEACGFSSVLLDNHNKDNNKATVTPPLLKNIQYCVFGLGNKQYDHFNAMGKFFHAAFSALGATPLLEIGLGDDDNDLEADFETWKDQHLWPTLNNKFITLPQQSQHSQQTSATTTTTIEHPESDLPETPFSVEYLTKTTNTTNDIISDTDIRHIHPSSRHYFDAVSVPVTLVRQLRSKHKGATGSTVHVELDISSSSFNYQTADNLGVLPINSEQHVHTVANCLGYDLNAVFHVKPAPGKEWHGAPFPMPLTVKHFLLHYCDLTAAPRRSELKLLALYATHKLDQQFLRRLASAEHKHEYQTKILDNYYGLVHLIQKCPSLNIPLEHFVDVCPRLQPRFFTIASSNLVHPTSIHLTVAVAQAQRNLKKNNTLPAAAAVDEPQIFPADITDMFQGVCSSYLAGQEPNRSIRVFVRPSTFRLPSDPSKPIIMIGPGTGIAPMRAFLQERDYQKHVLKLTVGRNILYFGCQRASQDYLYEMELKSFLDKGTLDELQVAFSREQGEGQPKVYVQHLLLRQSKETVHWIANEGAHVYVCGGVQMGAQVQETLASILVEQQTVASMTQAKEYLDGMAKQGRYIQELWA